MGDPHLLPGRIEAQSGGGEPAVHGDLPSAQQPDHRRISFGLCFSLWGKEVGRVHVRQPEFADLQLHQPHHWRFEGAGGHAAGGGQVHPDPAENPGSEYQDPSRKDGSGHQRHHREDHQTPALRLQAGGTVGADRPRTPLKM